MPKRVRYFLWRDPAAQTWHCPSCSARGARRRAHDRHVLKMLVERMGLGLPSPMPR